MRNIVALLVVFALGVGFGIWREGGRAEAQRAAAGAVGFAAIPTAIGSEDLTGPYEVVKGWPKDVSTLPGNEKWTYGAGQGVFAESPNRVFMLFRGELPKMPTPRRPPEMLMPATLRLEPSWVPVLALAESSK